jgi:hypothetical protein
VGRVTADLHVLDTAQMQWSGVIDLKKFSPEPRVGHSVCMWGSEMFVFGGGDSQTVFGDLCILDSEVLTREVQSAVASSRPISGSSQLGMSDGSLVPVLNFPQVPPNPHPSILNLKP